MSIVKSGKERLEKEKKDLTTLLNDCKIPLQKTEQTLLKKQVINSAHLHPNMLAAVLAKVNGKEQEPGSMYTTCQTRESRFLRPNTSVWSCRPGRQQRTTQARTRNQRTTTFFIP